MQSALERAFADLVLGPSIDLESEAELRAFLLARGVSEADVAAFVEQGGERLLVYRELVQSNLRDAIELSIPRSMARLGALFDEYLALFLRERGPRTHYLRDVTVEFLDFCEPLWKSDARVPDYALDLARHESLRIELGAQPTNQPAPALGEIDLERGVRFIEAARVVGYGHAVHQLSEAVDDREPPRAEPTWLFVYRSPEHEVRYLELTPLAADILHRLLSEGASLKSALINACAARGVALSSEVIQGTARVLSDLAERGALQGGMPARSCSERSP